MSTQRPPDHASEAAWARWSVKSIMYSKPKWIYFPELPSLPLPSSSLKLFWFFFILQHPVDVWFFVMWKKLHLILFLLSLLTNSLCSEPVRHALASLREVLNNISIPFCYTDFPHLHFFSSLIPSCILLLSLEAVTSYTFTNSCLLCTKIPRTKSMAVLQSHTLSWWCHLLVNLVWSLAPRFLSELPSDLVFRGAWHPLPPEGELQALNTFTQSICLAQGTQVLNCYCGFSSTAQWDRKSSTLEWN